MLPCLAWKICCCRSLTISGSGRKNVPEENSECPTQCCNCYVYIIVSMMWLQIVDFWFFTPRSHWRVYWHSAATSLSTYNAHSVNALKITVWINSAVKTWECTTIWLLTNSYILTHNIKKYCKHLLVQNKMLFLKTKVLKADKKREKMWKTPYTTSADKDIWETWGSDSSFTEDTSLLGCDGIVGWILLRFLRNAIPLP